MASSWQYYLLKAASQFVCLLPYARLLRLGSWLGRLYYRFGGRQRARAVAQAQDALAVDRAKAEQIIVSQFSKLGQNLLETMYLPRLNPANISRYVALENRQYLDEAIAEGKGVAVLSAHIGNWEWLGAALAMYGYPVASIVKRQPNDQHTRILNELRQAAGIEVFTRGTTELVAAVKALKQGRVLGFFVDQDAGVFGIFVKFLGRMASTPTGLAVFTRKLGVPVIPAFIVRRPEGGHRIIVGPRLPVSFSDDAQTDIYNLTSQATLVVEDMIRRYPDEWLWFQKRWNTKQAGEQA